MPFSLTHDAGRLITQVVVAAQMQHAVYDIECQFRLNIMTSLGGDAEGDLGTNNEFPFEHPGAGTAEGETQDVGGFVVVEKLFVEAMNGGIIDEGETDLVLINSLAFEDGPRGVAHLAPIRIHFFLWAGHLDL